jgi:hypothetical protein
MTNTIKFLKQNKIRLNGVLYTPYTVGNLPKTFAFIYDEENDKDGYTEWFNYKGLTYVQKRDLPF